MDLISLFNLTVMEIQQQHFMLLFSLRRTITWAASSTQSRQMHADPLIHPKNTEQVALAHEHNQNLADPPHSVYLIHPVIVNRFLCFLSICCQLLVTLTNRIPETSTLIALH